jgi:hypothetical protein
MTPTLKKGSKEDKKKRGGGIGQRKKTKEDKIKKEEKNLVEPSLRRKVTIVVD